MTAIEQDKTFDAVDGIVPVEYEAKVFGDNRGSFSEVLVGDELKDIKQINRSTSMQRVVRGCHAQYGKWCQAKLVEAVNRPIYDIITDARPDSKTFGVTAAYLLNPLKQNKLYVPRGFLHAFAVPDYVGYDKALFMYYCDNVYHKDAEICISPMSLLPNIVEQLKGDPKYEALVSMFENSSKSSQALVLSEKDLAGSNYSTWMQNVLDEYKQTGKCWYKG